LEHKKTQEALWLNSNLNPPWVEAELASMAPGTVQLNLFAWNMRLARYAKLGQYDKTVDLFKQMQQEGMIPNRFTFIPVLNAYASLQALEEGRWIHTQIIQSGCESDVYLGSSLINMYAKCGSIEDAWRVSNRMPTHDVVVWSAIISGHVKCGQGQKALALYQQMQLEGVEPDPVIFMGVLNVCGIVAALEGGQACS
jgi:pentatricopeptide repeat protein